MEKVAGCILKSDNVKIEGKYHLGINQSSQGPANEKNPNSASAQVRTLENHPQFSIMEVTCSCGAKIHVKCEYEN